MTHIHEDAAGHRRLITQEPVHMPTMAQEGGRTRIGSSPRARYLARFGGSMAIYVLSLSSASYLTQRHLADGGFIWVLALLPGLAIVGVFYAIARFIVEQKDEFLRMLLVRQALIGTVMALSISTVWGFLENFGLVARVDSYWVAVIWFVGFGFGGFINWMSYRARGDGS